MHTYSASWYPPHNYCSSHLGPRPTSLTRLQLADRLSVRKSTSGWPHPPLVSSSIIPTGSCQVNCHPCLLFTILAHCLTHPLVPLVTDREGATVRQGQKYGLALITLALCPAITYSSPSFPPLPSPPHPSPSVTSIKSNAIYSLALRHVLLQRLSCCTWPVLQKVLLRV